MILNQKIYKKRFVSCTSSYQKILRKWLKKYTSDKRHTSLKIRNQSVGTQQCWLWKCVQLNKFVTGETVSHPLVCVVVLTQKTIENTWELGLMDQFEGMNLNYPRNPRKWWEILVLHTSPLVFRKNVSHGVENFDPNISSLMLIHKIYRNDKNATKDVAHTHQWVGVDSKNKQNV